ncbi:MAG: biotin carboxylase N-terminal domain-containing protein, partial [Myxococcota bacterium]
MKKILVANRGEIACRILRTALDLGYETVAICSEADRNAPHTRLADEALVIGPAPSTESYLSIERILDAAKRTAADGIHPGYGFLSENAEFARACEEAGIVFIGPPVSAIEAMGKKQHAKAIARDADVPVVPGYDGVEQSNAALIQEAKHVGFPLLLKASAGGGGKGMRIVRAEEELEASIAAARREGEGAFGDGTLLIEKYLERPRHIEVQILGDAHGSLVHLFERECSIQRRHQKIIEEAPSPWMTEERRRAMTDAALRMARAIGYQNAGTVEFIVAPNDEFYFLEVNTRLQVEHPVTECV